MISALPPLGLESNQVMSFMPPTTQHTSQLLSSPQNKIIFYVRSLSWLNQSLPANFKVQVINNTYYRFNDTTHSRVGNFVFQPGKLRKEVTSFYCLSSMSRKLHKEMLFRSVNTSQTVTLTIKSLFLYHYVSSTSFLLLTGCLLVENIKIWRRIQVESVERKLVSVHVYSLCMYLACTVVVTQDTPLWLGSLALTSASSVHATTTPPPPPPPPPAVRMAGKSCHLLPGLLAPPGHGPGTSQHKHCPASCHTTPYFTLRLSPLLCYPAPTADMEMNTVHSVVI